MKDLYLEDEERFGPVTSWLYYIAAQLPLLRYFYKFVIDDLLESNAKRILDVGTGPGDIPLALAKHNKFEKHIYAIDPSPDMIKIARNRENTGKVVFAVGSSRRVPFDKKFDIIFTAASYHHWKAQEYSLKHLKFFLKEGGEIRIYEHDMDKIGPLLKIFGKPHALDKKRLYKVAEAAGLKVTEEKTKGSLIRVSLKRR